MLRPLTPLTCVAAIIASVIPASASAAPQPFPVSLSVTGVSSTDVNEVTVVATSVTDARCALDVRGETFAKSFAAKLAGPGGAVTWRWPAPGARTDVQWRFTATCRLGSLWSARWTEAELGFPTRGGALPPWPSVAASTVGASCNVQGVCFAGDPFAAGECSWYVAGRRGDLLSLVHGDAGDWLEQVRGRVPEGWRPAVGAVAVWLPGHDGAGEDGHVAYVAAVSGGRILVDDSNWRLTPTGPGLQIHEHWVSVVAPSGYIYGGPAGTGPRV
ncbi:MAG TPA: CHAP domain-containing protein [Solirubrobacteraceae bacterium]|nr:CHAP domain-containing protein [Solirubrobacteraceae bacterium]